MKIRSRILMVLLALALVLSGCAGNTQNVAQTEQPTVAVTEAAETQPAATEAVAVEEDSQLHYRPVLSETVLPEKDAATGTLFFYLNDKAVYAGGPVSDLIEVGFHSFTDMNTVVQPWHMSEVVRVLVDIPEVDEDDEPYIFFVAMNASDEPCAISECLIYSITVNGEKGIRFGSGKESEAFISRESTREQIVEAYGEPDESVSNYYFYEEIFYYEPFSSVSFSFENGIVRQISSYYSANVYGSLAEKVEFEHDISAMKQDAYILMAQYMDVAPYVEKLAEAEKEEEEETQETQPVAEDETEETEEPEDKTGILSQFNDYCEVNGSKIEFGCKVSELPSPFLEDINDLAMPVNRDYYVRTGRHDPEEFYLINHEGQINSRSNNLLVKGIITENRNYCNWGIDNTAFHEFNCQGITQDSTIDDILEMFGQPRDLVASSGERTCFLWMHYETEEGSILRVRVDPMLNQVIEVHMSKYFENERSY